MTTGDSPAGARRRLRLAIRRIREATGRTQGQVAEELSWSISKVNRIETGEVTISRTDLQALLRLLDFRDEREAARLLEDARLSRVRGWWDRPEFRPYLDSTLRQLVQLESEATAIRSFQFAAFPGLLQIREYAAAVIDAAFASSSAESRAARVDLRMLRQENLDKRSSRPMHIVILDEFLLQRIIGGADVTARQLKALTESARRPDVCVRLLPKEESVSLFYGAFVLYDVVGETSFLYREGLSEGVVERSETVQQHRAKFDQMWKRCLTEDATLSAVEAQHAAIRANLERYS
ncbi:helix-turn-helix transcriptional regulator [Dactylosporangium sp. NPDC049525]|uniref:helix-turn-helix domain-containing protein n=1 Tax=Dactylosporangium sp. NPDC049525 TaxID=3154730 RepID=UPI0034478EFE